MEGEIFNTEIIIQWKLDTACKALAEALQNLEAVQRYIEMRGLEQKQKPLTLKDLGWKVIA